MSEFHDTQERPRNDFRKLLQQPIGNANPSRELTAEEAKRLVKLEAIADKLKRGENVQNHQLKTWLTEDECAQIDAEWQEQLCYRGKDSAKIQTESYYNDCKAINDIALRSELVNR